jgi:predicted Zn-dependent protease
MRRRTLRHAAALALLLTLTACAVNPATGRRELSLVSESQEIAMGREYDPQVVAQMGLYADDDMQAYVSELGLRMAAVSERPQLPWKFQVVDDPVVNAFAVPGGFIYITRGILAHLGSEAELAGVLGHEIGHITARHSASQMTRVQLQQIGLGIGGLLSDRVAGWSDAIGAGLGVLNLSYGRGDESESDELGVRYMTRTGYDPASMAGVFETLALVSGDPESRTPEWASSHPYPENREARIREMVAELPAGQRAALEIRSDAYLTMLQDLTYGPDPRQGYFEGSLFLHPEMAFQLRFPEGWTAQNQRTQVVAVSPSEDAAVVLELASQESPDAALRTFLGQDGVTAGATRNDPINGLAAARATFGLASQDGRLDGAVAFVAHGGLVFQIMGVGTPSGWGRAGAAVDGAIASFAEVRDPAVLDVEPRRIDIVRLPMAMTLEEFYDRYPTPLELDEVSRLNRRSPGEVIAAGTLLKRVRGGP